MEAMALTESTYYILLALYHPQHGYGIMQQTEQLSGGRVHLAAGTLYGALNSLCEKGWIRQLPVERGSRKKEYQLTAEGLAVLKHELARLQRDRIAEQEDAQPLITEPSGFDKLEAVLPGEFTRMRSTRQLRLEGQRQRNCAFSRRGLLRSDTAAIFHWDCGEKSYTVQFGILPNGRYSIDEMRGRCNEPCLPEHRRKLEGLLRGINRKGALGA